MPVLGKVPGEEMKNVIFGFTVVFMASIYVISLVATTVIWCASLHERKDMAVKEFTTCGDIANSIEGAYANDDVAELGQPVFTISSVRERQVGQEAEKKTCVSFQEVAKFVVMNKTRSAQLTALFGVDGNPVGKKVRLFVDLVKVGNMSHRMICFGEPK